MDYNGSFKSRIVRDGLDVCGGNVFQSLITVLGINEYNHRSDTNIFESASHGQKYSALNKQFLKVISEMLFLFDVTF